MGMSMVTSSSSRDTLDDLTEAIGVVVEHRKKEGINDNSHPDSMKIDVHEYTPVVSSNPCLGRPLPKADLIGHMIPPLLRSKDGLGNLPPETLRENLQPIVEALKKLDAELLLGLERSNKGPKVRDGVCCRPIYEQVKPAVAGHESADGQSCVRYLHISEIPDHYSIGIFVFAPYSRIPLHDHPEMCVLSRVLYGDLQRVSLDLAREKDIAHSFGDSNAKSSWFGSWGPTAVESMRKNLPKGSKFGFKNHVDYLQAPDVTALYPFEGNLHQFVAGPDGAAVLDVLLPPYDNSRNRDCTFYEIREVASSLPRTLGKEPCVIIPTGQPEDFHCISGKYRDLGESDDLE